MITNHDCIFRRDLAGWIDACKVHGRIHTADNEYMRQLERENRELRARILELENAK